MSDLWVARDADGTLLEVGSKPVRRGGFWMVDDMEHFKVLPSGEHPDLPPGECRRLVIEKEKGE